MNIVVCVRTLNEEDRIGLFCSAYGKANRILVADGGSQDSTVDIARCFSNVEVRNYLVKRQLKHGYWRNPDSDHANFLFEWAYSLHPDWIIFDDCDIRPNYLLKKNYIDILSLTDKDVVMAVRVYLWEKGQYFPTLSSPLGEEKGQPSLWAWRGNVDLWTVDEFPHFSLRIGNKPVKSLQEDARTLQLVYPYCLLHYSWINPEMVDAKIKYYRESGAIPGMLHPLEFGGALKPVESWMKE